MCRQGDSGKIRNPCATDENPISEGGKPPLQLFGQHAMVNGQQEILFRVFRLAEFCGKRSQATRWISPLYKLFGLLMENDRQDEKKKRKWNCIPTAI
jgi:hypothetical protein